MIVKDWYLHCFDGRCVYFNRYHYGWGVIDGDRVLYFDNEKRLDLVYAMQWLKNGVWIVEPQKPCIEITRNTLKIIHTKTVSVNFKLIEHITVFTVPVKRCKNIVEQMLLLDEHVKLLPTHNDNVLLHNGEFLFDGSTDEIEIQGMLLKRNGKKYKLKYEQNLPD